MTARDWPARLTVTVTADDIRAGHPLDAQACPVALAVRRVLGIGHHDDRYLLLAETECIEVTDTDHDPDDDIPEPVAGWRTPSVVREFMDVFDAGLAGGPVKPFTFTAERAS